MQLLCSVVGLLLAPAVAIAADIDVDASAIYDLQADDHSVCLPANGLSVTLGAGAYTFDAVDGTYRAWSPWSSTSGCDVTGANCTRGYRARMTLRDDATGSEWSRYGASNTLYSSADLAFANRDPATEFCVTEEQDYRLTFGDSQCSDNRGGQTIELARLDSDCSSVLCYGDVREGDDDDDGICNDLDVCPTIPDHEPDVDAGSALGLLATLDTCTLPDRYPGNLCQLDTDTMEGIVDWVAPQTATYRFTFGGPQKDVVVGYSDDCAGSPLACYQVGSGGPITDERVVTGGESLRFVVEHYNRTLCETFTVSAETCPDNEGDGACDLCLGDVSTGDTDGDEVCDDLDLCDGDDATGDTDADGVCDDVDVCSGDNATGDTDSDGVCDDLDVCDGDDATGDTDGDQICDDEDFTLHATPIVAGSPMTFSVRNAPAGARVFFLVSTRLGTQPLCHPTATGNACTDLRQPTVVGQATADAAGSAAVVVTPPSSVPEGTTVYAQAFALQGGVGDVTELDVYTTVAP